MQKESIREFIEFANNLKGDEKGEAQLYIDRLFRAFGHGGIIEANGSLETRIKFSTGKTKFADCIWLPPKRPGVLIEMKKKGEKYLETHFPQARDYWIEMNPETIMGEGAQKPEYIILCNFEKFIIYRYLSPVDEIYLKELPDRLTAFNFLLPNNSEPIFRNNVEEISEEAAKLIGTIFKYQVYELGQDRQKVQRFLLQCVLALFSEDFGLLPNGFFSKLIRDCLKGESSFDLFGSLFKQMASPKQAPAGRFREIEYFNGGLFEIVDPLDLDHKSLEILKEASEKKWQNVNPVIFGSLFESTLTSTERHTFGAHFTREPDILKIVNPTIIKPWKAKIEKAKTLGELTILLEELSNFKVLDPSCGCGNFLYVAFKVLKDIEFMIIEKIALNFKTTKHLKLGLSKVSIKQFYGIDIQPIAVEVAKMTMMLGKEILSAEWNKRIEPFDSLGLILDQGLPLDTLNKNIYCADAILDPWPNADVIIGNPPYQSKNKMKMEMDHEYVNLIRERYPDMPGRADYCVYWFRKTHDQLQDGKYAGLVGTNTIRQNDSRVGGLDYILNNGGTIVDAVSTQVWSGV
ncbi:DNA methyltransferase [Leptospira stimsonii]|uniref:site-specific DNA-methyltransferase (adenine-specific) n=1 Tax=Leptospira stimsonii TaxID=2202203 RepID=A0A396YNJ8_9LEPT|nr:DNA methyltransferase [Leptospira stimsonii]RHX84691.1 hypothetical protein DLM75_21975 [Leptospira stimsonii]